MRHKPNKILLTTILTALALVVIIIRDKDKNRPMEVRIDEAGYDELIESIPCSGKVRPVVEVIISPDVSGEIVKINFEEGDTVKRGDVILQIKQDLYRSVVEQAEAALGTLKAQNKKCQAELELAEQIFRRSESLYILDAIPMEEYENAKASLKIASESFSASKYNVLSGEAALREANENLIKTTILSPIDGIVSMMNVEEGERVVGTTQMAGTEMFRIADFSRMEAVVEVSENDIVRIKQGDSASIEVDAYPRVNFRGFVTQIANSAQNIGSLFDQVTNFEVRIEILSDNHILLPGMSASSSIVTEKGKRNLAIPVSAVFAREKREYVWVVGRDLTVEEREITTGIQDLNSIEVTSGLIEGEKVVVAPAKAISEELFNGRRVKFPVNENRK